MDMGKCENSWIKDASSSAIGDLTVETKTEQAAANTS
jgi:hypothetical protein